MTKEKIEELVGHELAKDAVSLDKKIYAGKLYFYKREIQQDHYFYVADKEALYKMIFNPDNYNPSKVETGKYEDSFQYPFDEYLAEGKIEEVNGSIKEHTTIVETIKKETSLKDELDEIIMKLVELKSKL